MGSTIHENEDEYLENTDPVSDSEDDSDSNSDNTDEEESFVIHKQRKLYDEDIHKYLEDDQVFFSTFQMVSLNSNY